MVRSGILTIYLTLTIIKLSQCLNVFIFTSCYTGHTTPTLGIARSLQARGHNLEFLASSDCCESKIQPGLKEKVKCSSRLITSVDGIKANSQFEGLIEIKETAAENGTWVAFHEVNDFLNQNPNYDVMLSDWFLLGGTIAGQKHNIPVVTNFVGSAFFPLKKESSDNSTFTYIPETNMPQFMLDFIEFFISFTWHNYASRRIYDLVTEINEKYNMPTLLKNAGRTFNLPLTYPYTFSNVIHFGPPEIFLQNLEFMKEKTNVHNLGYVPQPESYGTLVKHALEFVENSKLSVIYMSLGTVFRMELPKLEKLLIDLSQQNEFSVIWSANSYYYQALKKLNLDNPKFLLVQNIAQLQLLMHEKTVAFLTHAGGNSLTEGIFSETPMIVFPGFGDQPPNAKKLVEAGMALPLVELSHSEISRKLGQLLDPKFYSECQKRLKKSKTFMTSLGGYEKAADIVEKIASSEIQVIEPEQLLNVEEVLYRKFYFYAMVFVVMLLLMATLIFKICCRGTSKEKTA